MLLLRLMEADDGDTDGDTDNGLTAARRRLLRVPAA